MKILLDTVCTMAIYKIKLINRKEIARDTMAFYFEKPKNLSFVAGQHAVLELPNPPETDDKGSKRVFCFASAPCEKDLMFATRMRDTAFKRVLKTMPLGGEVIVNGPYGSFVLHEDAALPAVFLVGWIGITPIRSMLLEAAQENSSREFYLFYSNRKPEEAAFIDELKDRALSHYKFIPIMSDAEGYIDQAKLVKHLNNPIGPIYYVVGPPEFVLAMRGILNEMGINPDDIKTDQFFGY